MSEFTTNQKTTNINNIVLSDRLVLNHIWPNVLAKYWQNYDDGHKARNLYDILEALNIENIAPVYRNNKNQVIKHYDLSNVYESLSNHKDIQDFNVEYCDNNKRVKRIKDIRVLTCKEKEVKYSVTINSKSNDYPVELKLNNGNKSECINFNELLIVLDEGPKLVKVKTHLKEHTIIITISDHEVENRDEKYLYLKKSGDQIIILENNVDKLHLDKSSVHILSSEGGEVLVTLTAVENDIKFITENLFRPVNGYEHILGRLKVKIPPVDSLYTIPNTLPTPSASENVNKLSQAEIIANYQLLGFYFPLSQLFDSYKGAKGHYGAPEKATSIADKKNAAAKRIVKSLAIAIDTWWKDTHNQNSTDKFVNRLRNVILNILINQHKKAGEKPNPVGQLFDRGGAQAFDDDFNWQYFVPRMVAYNWNHKWQTAVVRFSQSLEGEKTLTRIEDKLQQSKEKCVDEVYKILKDAKLIDIIVNNFENTITDGDQLSSYPEMLETLEYKIIDGLNIFIKYADKLPQDNDGWHPEDYACELEVILPAPPEIEDIGASAIADFTALRASQPFTVG